MQYEMFIRRAHGCGRDQKGASCNHFAKLQTTESGRLNLSFLGSADKRLVRQPYKLAHQNITKKTAPHTSDTIIRLLIRLIMLRSCWSFSA